MATVHLRRIHCAAADAVEQLAALRAHNISISDPQPTNGYAISVGKTGYSLLQPLMTAIAAHPESDTVYMISDFKGGDETDNDSPGYQQLREVLRERRLRLYFATVDHVPPLAVYRDIASSSGGGVIEDYKDAQPRR